MSKQFALDGARRAIETARLYLKLAALLPDEDSEAEVNAIEAEISAVEIEIVWMQEEAR